MYKIIGADQKEYGPVSGDQLRQWIRDGRVNAHTRVRLESGGDWQPLSAFPEFADAFQPGVAAPPSPIPAMAPMAGGGSREAALQAVKAPAICLIVTAGLGIALFSVGAISNFLGNAVIRTPPANMPPEMQNFYQSMQNARGPLGGLLDLFFVAMDVVVLLGALKMMRLQSRGFAMTACIVAMLPFTIFCCCILGLPFGIWGMVVLNKPEVKSQFT